MLRWTKALKTKKKMKGFPPHHHYSKTKKQTGPLGLFFLYRRKIYPHLIFGTVQFGDLSKALNWISPWNQTSQFIQVNQIEVTFPTDWTHHRVTDLLHPALCHFFICLLFFPISFLLQAKGLGGVRVPLDIGTFLKTPGSGSVSQVTWMQAQRLLSKL